MNQLPSASKTMTNSTNSRPLPKKRLKETNEINSINNSTPLRNDSNVLTEMIPTKNIAGTNSCFINVVFRLLYHAKLFRNSILNYKQTKVNLFIQIQDLFKKYKDLQMQTPSSKGNFAIDVSLLRKELSKLFQGYHQGISGDPLDVFINIMTAVHSHHVNSNLSEDNSAVCKPLCPAHSCFALKLHEEICCSQCKMKTNSVYDNNYYVYEVYMWEIMNIIKDKPFNDFNKMLFEKISTVTSIFDYCAKFCKCPNQSSVSKAIILEGTPNYLMIHLTWDIMSPPLVDLCNLYAMIPLTAHNNSLFKLAKQTVVMAYELKSIITFYNGHYTSCFKSIKENKWFFCDDMVIKEFNSWSLLMQHMVKNHYHPIALCYDIAKTKTVYEHINQKDYQELYSNCFSHDRSKEDNSKSPFNVIERHESANSFLLLNKRRSGIFNRYSSINGESSQSLIQDDQIICSSCGKTTSASQIKCFHCLKQITKRPSNLDNDNHWQESAGLDNIKNAVSIKFDDSDIPIKNLNKIDLLRAGNCDGIKNAEINFGNIRQCETNKAMFDRNSSTEAEMGEGEGITIERATTKEMELSVAKGREYVLSSPTKNSDSLKSQFKPKIALLKNNFNNANDNANKNKQNIIKPLEQKSTTEKQPQIKDNTNTNNKKK